MYSFSFFHSDIKLSLLMKLYLALVYLLNLYNEYSINTFNDLVYTILQFFSDKQT
jgi:hypothetical protein